MGGRLWPVVCHPWNRLVTWWHGDMVTWWYEGRTPSHIPWVSMRWTVLLLARWNDRMSWSGPARTVWPGRRERLHDRWRHLDGFKSDVSHVSSVKYSRQCWAAQCPMSAERCRKLRGSSHHGTLFIAASKILGPSTGLARDIIKTCQELPSNVSERNSFLKISHPSSSPVLVSFFLWTKAEDIKIPSQSLLI